MKTKRVADSGPGGSPSEQESVRDVPLAPKRSTVAKVSHTLSVALAERLEEFAFFQRISESAVIEHCLNRFFLEGENDQDRGDVLRREGAGRRRKS